MRMQTKSYAPSGHYSAESIAFSRYSLAMLAVIVSGLAVADRQNSNMISALTPRPNGRSIATSPRSLSGRGFSMRAATAATPAFAAGWSA